MSCVHSSEEGVQVVHPFGICGPVHSELSMSSSGYSSVVSDLLYIYLKTNEETRTRMCASPGLASASAAEGQTDRTNELQCVLLRGGLCGEVGLIA